MNLYIKDKYIPTKALKSRAFFLIFVIVIIYVIENSPIAYLIDSMKVHYVLKPALWIGLFLIVYLLPEMHPKSSLKLRGFLYLWSFNFAIIYIVVSILAGVIDGIGKSPYLHTPLGILLNILFVGSMILGREYARSFLVNNLANKEEKIAVFVLISLLMVFSKLSVNRIINLNSYYDTVQYIGKYVAPEFCHSLLATYLVFLGGPFTSLIYFGVIEGFHWLSPILPDLKWITTALIGVLVPIFCLIGIQNIYMITSKKFKNNNESKENPIIWMSICLISIGIVWFAVGVFPIYPSAVATGSMEPMIKPGDVILVKKIQNLEEINIGDVIFFEKEKIYISHRVIDIKEDKKGKVFKTKGDNNSVEDSDLVSPDQLKGIVVKVVPKIGWPTLFIKSKNDIPLEDVIF